MLQVVFRIRPLNLIVSIKQTNMKWCYLILWPVVWKWVPHSWIYTVLRGITSQWLLWELVIFQPGWRHAAWFSSAACCSAPCQGGRAKFQMTFPSLEFSFLLSFGFSWCQAKKAVSCSSSLLLALQQYEMPHLLRTIQLQAKRSWLGTEERVSEVKGAIFCPLVCRNMLEVNLKG